MIGVILRFYGDLNNLIRVKHKGKTFERQLPGPASAKDVIEGCGVPHTEVDLMLVGSKPIDFSYLITDNDQISIYPCFSNLTIPAAQRLQPPTPSLSRFLVDVNLGKLARYLRLGGFDATYHNDATDDMLITEMQQEDRILLTRDRKLLMRKVVKHGYLPQSDDPVEQLKEVLKRFELFDKVNAFSRCPRCNGQLQTVPKTEIIDQLEPLTKRHYDSFSQCPDCEQVYWAGSHRKRMDSRLLDMLGY